MNHGFFVTGTDTGVGKTLVATGLLWRAGALGLRTSALKPVAAGCEMTADGLRNEDALLLQRACNLDIAYTQLNPVALEPAVAPHLAAAAVGMHLDVAALARHCRRLLESDVDLALVEGAGGWRVPLNDTETLADLARELALPVILVVAMRLGCINHALLTAEAVRADGLTLAGWVANRVDPSMACYPENLAALEQRLGCPLLGELPFLPQVSGAEAASFLDLPPGVGPMTTARQRCQ